MVATLGSYGSALALDHAEHLGLGVVVLAVVLSLTLSRTHRAGDAREWLLGLGILSLLALAADEVGSLLVRHQNAGEALFVLAIGGSIWIRRFGPLFARAGTLVALPFVALLITPAVPGAAHEHLLWSAVTGMIAYLWVTIVREAGERAGLLARPADPRATRAPRPRATRAPRRRATRAPARSAVQAPAPRAARASKPARRRLPASTRMAIQMGAALAASFAVGRALFGHHWSWTVLSAFIVCSGNRGRGDVLYKSVLRITGAATGTVLATLIAGNVAPGDSSTVVVIFVLLGIASWLRAFSYAYWAAAITAVLALLYGYFGESGTHLLGERLEGILLGAGIAVAVSWVLLPVRTSDVLRRRIANTLAALGELLGALGADDEELVTRAGSFDAALDSLEEIARPLETHRLLRGRDSDRAHLADTIDAARRLRAPVERLLELVASDPQALEQPDLVRWRAAVAREIVAARRALAGRYEQGAWTDAQAPSEELQLPESAFEELEAALRDLARSYREARAPA